MSKFKRYVRAFLAVVRVLGLGIGLLLTAAGGIQDLSGGTGFLTITPARWMIIGQLIFIFFVAVLVVRHEYQLWAVGELYGNEHARKLLADGIPPYNDQYLHYVGRGDYATVNRFWLAGRVNIMSHGGRTDLHIATASGFATIARGILERGGDTKRADDQGNTALILAAASGHLSVVELLLEHDPAFDARSAKYGVSALHAASSNGHRAVVERLIAAGPQVDLVDNVNMTPLMGALARQKWDIAAVLLDAGADPKRADGFGASVLDYAISSQAPADLEQKIRVAGGKQAEPPIYKRGSSHTGDGRTTMTWSHEPPKPRTAPPPPPPPAAAAAP